MGFKKIVNQVGNAMQIPSASQSNFQPPMTQGVGSLAKGVGQAVDKLRNERKLKRHKETDPYSSSDMGGTNA